MKCGRIRHNGSQADKGFPLKIAEKRRIGLQAFLAGFAQSGLFCWANYPGSPTVLCEENTDLADSQFADLLAPLVFSATRNIPLRPIRVELDRDSKAHG